MNTRGQAATWVLIVLAVILVGGGVYYFGTHKIAPTYTSNNSNTTSSGATDWKTYTNKTYGFSFIYPPDWTVKDKSYSHNGERFPMAFLYSPGRYDFPGYINTEIQYYIMLSPSSGNLTCFIAPNSPFNQAPCNINDVQAREGQPEYKIGQQIIASFRNLNSAPLPGVDYPQATSSRQTIYSPDANLVAYINTSSSGENEIEIWNNGSGGMFASLDFISADGQHGGVVTQTGWTPDSKYFVFTVADSGGHQPWREWMYAYKFGYGVYDMDSFLMPQAVPSSDKKFNIALDKLTFDKYIFNPQDVKPVTVDLSALSFEQAKIGKILPSWVER